MIDIIIITIIMIIIDVGHNRLGKTTDLSPQSSTKAKPLQRLYDDAWQ
jgi:hypothetical protein